MSILWIKDSHKQGGSSSQTIVVTPDRLDEGNFKTVAYEKHLPKKLSTDTLLLVKENGDLYIGTGSGIKKITGQIKVDPGNNGQTVDLSEYLKTKNADEKYATKTELSQVQSGTNGKSAYEIAKENGYTGTTQEWLLSLKGEKGSDGVSPDMSQYATKEDLLHVQTGANGKSAYEIAVEKGFVGDEQAWLASLKGEKGADGTTPDMSQYATKEELSHVQAGEKGADGKSAYQIAVEKGYIGDETSWLASLKGEKGADGVSPDMSLYATKEDLTHVTGAKGEDGAPGKSAYELAQEAGYVGSKEDWLASLKGDKGVDGVSGTNGKSAYQIAEEVHGTYKGGEQEWLDSLVGKSAYQIAVEHGYSENEETWLKSLKGADGTTPDMSHYATKDDLTNVGAGKSAYDIAKEEGFAGSKTEWLASLKGNEGTPGRDGNPGDPGKSAYQVAVDKGFIGDEQTWLNSLKGQNGSPGENGAAGESAYQIAQRVKSFIGSESDWLNSLRGADGLPGVNGSQGENGKSAYQIAIEKGFIGDEQAWLTSLKGQDGTPGESAYQIAQRVNSFKGSEQDWLNSLKGQDGSQGAAGESAYEIAKRVKSFTGAEEDWLNSLKGQDGVTPSTENFVQKKELEQYVKLEEFIKLKKEFDNLKAKVEAAHSSP